jgi:hypothetical protein
MKKKLVIIGLLLFLLANVSLFAAPGFNFYVGGGLAGLMVVANGELQDEDDGDFPGLIGLTGEAFGSFTVVAARLCLDYYTIVIVNMPVLSAELGLTFPTTSRVQAYLGAGAGVMQIRIGSEKILESPTMMTITGAVYFKIGDHFGMGVSCTYMTLFENYSDTGFLTPRVTLGWKL